MPMAADHGVGTLRRDGEICQIIRYITGLVPQSGLGTAMQDPARDADDALDQRFPFGVGNRAGRTENVDPPGFVAIA